MLLLLAERGEASEPANSTEIVLDRNITEHHITLKDAAIAIFRIRPPEALETNETTFYFQWIPDMADSTARIALLVNEGLDQPRLYISGKNKEKRTCSRDYPCESADVWDDVSFYTRPGYAFLALRSKVNLKDITVALKLVARREEEDLSIPGALNVQYITNSRNISKLTNDTNAIQPNGTRVGNQTQANVTKLGKQANITKLGNQTNETKVANNATDASVRNNTKVMCGGRNGECSQKGRCIPSADVGGHCSCDTRYGGRFCEDPLNEWLCKKNELPTEYTLQVKANEWSYVRYKNCDDGFYAQLRAPEESGVEIYGRVRGASCNNIQIEYDYDTLPSRFDEQCKARPFRSGTLRVGSKELLTERGYFDIAVYSQNSTEVTLKLSPCARAECDTESGFPSLPFLILPICLCILCVAAAVVCVLLYVDRRHGFVTGPDKLSPTELRNMCPEYTLLATDDPAHEEHRMCAICLCDFAVGDKLRRLKCDHRFHSECIDPWLTLNNATCPTCREEARVPELSERRLQRAIIKHVLAPILRLPLRARSRRISPMSRMFRADQLQHSDPSGTPTDDGINYCADEARDLPDVETGAAPQCVRCTTPPPPPPPPPTPPDRDRRVQSDRPRTREEPEDEDAIGVQHREESGLSTASYYTAPLNHDAPTAAALRAQGVLPHVRAALDPAHQQR